MELNRLLRVKKQVDHQHKTMKGEADLSPGHKAGALQTFVK